MHSNMLSPADTHQYDDATLALLATNLEDNDVLYVFQQVIRFREHGFLKAYLPDWNTKRRRYDNAFLILEATKFIVCVRAKNGYGASTPYFPTARGVQLVEYILNELDPPPLPPESFKKLTDEQYEQFERSRSIP
ncbi:hypothetical protein PV433_33645 [Paenibacillus sp. GYB004]|uniref:hypothetical protein n=1 Tax=Paenibacillus sp. GYB004 TaxID=2994393 RepID=UPI002F96986C